MIASQPFAPEVHSLFLRPFLDEAPPAKLREILDRFGIEESRLRDQAAWVSLRFCEDFFEQLIDGATDPAIFDRCGRLALSPRYLGILRPLFRAFGTPLFAFRQVAQSTARFNKVGRMTLTRARPGFVDLEYRALPGAPVELSPFICQARRAQLGAIPTMFDLLPAQVGHPVCLHTGGELCRYEFRWTEYGNRRASWLLLMLGLPAGAATAAALGGGGAGTVAGALLGGVTSWALARIAELQRRLTQQAADVTEGQDALARSVRFHEEQFTQVTEAKAEVERKVEERTQQVVEANHKLAAALDDMRALEQAERTFFANISHDLRTPLTLILAPLEEALGGVLAPDLRVSLETIRRSAWQLRSLIDQLLDLEKIQAGRVELARAPLDVRALLDSVRERFAPLAVKQGLRLLVTATAGADPVVADARWLDSALMNVVANAVRFARSRVDLRLVDGPEALVVEIDDDGPGIPPHELPHVFDRFVQAGTPSERRGGSGLGLTIAREAARLHGGNLTAQSQLGHGTTFTLTLPRVAGEVVAPSEAVSLTGSSGALVSLPSPAGLTAAAHAPDRTAKSAAPATPYAVSPQAVASIAVPDADQQSWPGPDPEAPLVAVIEDDDELRVFIARTLAAHYRVEVARDGLAGLALIHARHPDAIVCDVAMPYMDGYELCRRARAEASSRMTPILLVTARSNVDRVLEGLEAGANDYVTKPFHPRELVARLEAHLTLRRVLKDVAHKERLVTLGLLAASVAHQVRNPLSALKNTVVALQRRIPGGVVPDAAPMFTLVNECVGRIERFTTDLLDLSRVERAELGEFTPARGIESVIRLLSTRLPATVTIEATCDRTVEVAGRPGDLNHVFMNLIDNALRAVGPHGTVRVDARRDGGDFLFEVADSGPGVSDEKREWIFEPFATTRTTDGTGLGLYIVRKIVSEHGGQISVDRSPLGGALFRVRIPAARAAPPQLPRAGAASTRPGGATAGNEANGRSEY